LFSDLKQLYPSGSKSGLSQKQLAHNAKWEKWRGEALCVLGHWMQACIYSLQTVLRIHEIKTAELFTKH
jgi:DMSO reductase anchor subunit